MELFDSVPAVPLHARRELLQSKGHICALFKNEDEKYQTMAGLMKEAIEQGERAHHVINPARQAEHYRYLSEAGIDVDTALQTGQLRVRDWSETYFHEGAVSYDRAIQIWTDVSDESIAQGYPRTQFISQMGWAADQDLDRLMEYEAEYELAVRSTATIRDVVFCCYDLSQWSSELIMRTLRTHSLVIVGGILYENPFYTSASEVLAELRLHRSEPCGCDDHPDLSTASKTA